MRAEVFLGLGYNTQLRFRKKVGVPNFEPTKRSDLDKVVNLVCEYFELDKTKFLGRSRIQKYSVGRMYYGYLSRQLTEENLAQIGRFIGRNHATVVHYVKTIENWITFDVNVVQELETLKQKFYE